LSRDDGRIRITIWHQDRIDAHYPAAADRPVHADASKSRGTTLQGNGRAPVRLIIAALAGQGPEIVYGPSDQVGPFEIMNIILPLEKVFEEEWLAQYDERGLTRYKGHLYQVADKLGNHLTLVYNKKLVPVPPTTEVELIEAAKKVTADLNGDGKTDRYGLTWNYTEPFFFIPFMTGFGGWIMDSAGTPTLDSRGTIDGLNFIKQLRDVHKIILTRRTTTLQISSSKMGMPA
jgi:maltose-binding protein MalE